MLLTLMKSKIHRAFVTETELAYVGSITIDEELIEAANMVVNERVQVVNLNNGNRFETYIINGKRGEGEICLNGPAARLALPGDEIIIITYAMMDEQEAKGFEPVVVHVDKKNRIVHKDHNVLDE